MHEPNVKDLKPLRKFALNGVYSSVYLSQLVQRGKLKAKKIGRNYYTTENWFKEYLNLHARDGKQSDCLKALQQNEIEINISRTDTTAPNGGSFLFPAKTAKRVRPLFSFNLYKTIAIIMGMVMIVMANVFYWVWRDSQGRIAGAEEKAAMEMLETATSSKPGP